MICGNHFYLQLGWCFGYIATNMFRSGDLGALSWGEKIVPSGRLHRGMVRIHRESGKYHDVFVLYI